MKNTSVIISTYTADVSGVCSALYELGGMVVIHDPSGCNSTYNTHDEPRWYDMDSLVFISGLSEMDAILGNDEKLIEDIVRAARNLKPRFIALVRTPVPMMTGTDFEGIREILERETGIPAYYFPTNGMHSYIQGVNMALKTVAEHMTGSAAAELLTRIDSKKEIGVNLLGVTPLDFSVNATLASVKSILRSGDFRIVSCFAMGSSPEEIARAGEASVNLVLSSAGIEAARVLFRRFGTPYVVGLPTGRFAEKVMDAMRDSVMTGKNHIAYLPQTRTGFPGEFHSHSDKYNQENSVPEDTGNRYNASLANSRNPGEPVPEEIVEQKKEKVCLIGEAVIAQSIREAVYLGYGFSIKVLCSLETPEPLLDEDSEYLASEEELKNRLSDADVVIADPMFRPICPEEARFISFPHEAFSGRIYRKDIPDLTRPEDILYNR